MPTLSGTRARVLGAVFAAGALAAGPFVVPVSAAAPTFTPGAPGAGDPYFPDMGNGGYDVAHYRISLRFFPRSGRIASTTTIRATATQDLSRFNLDLRGLTVRAITVNGAKATWARTGAQELEITPKKGLRTGTKFVVTVRYAGKPQRIDDPALGVSGWVATKTGAVALNQPFGAATYFPVNDTPQDKATYTQIVTVPSGLKVFANGEPGRVRRHQGLASFRWQMNQPMASELSSIAIGKYDATRSVVRDGTGRRIRSITAISTRLNHGAARQALFAKTTARVVRSEVALFGRYPFSSTGGLIDNVGVGYALEVQGRPVYSQSDSTVDAELLAHELAHQWYGDSLTPKYWSDIWLNEGFATYAEWLWREHKTGVSATTTAHAAYDAETDWTGTVADPGRDHIFDDLVYTRGAIALQALRQQIGGDAFLDLIKAWANQHRYSNVTTAEFVSFAEARTGQSLSTWAHDWLYTSGKPVLGEPN